MTCIQLHKEYTVYVIIQIPFDTAVKSYEEEKNTFDTAVKSFEEEKTHLFAFQATGCRLPSWGPGYTKADKKENKLQEQTLSRALIILKLFYIFQSEETSSKT